MAEAAASMRAGLRRARRRLRGWLGQHPALYLPLAGGFRRAFDGSRKAVSRETEVVIEGFPRCGNSFAFAAFSLAQPRPVRIAHHLHAPAQIIAGAKHGIPTVVLIRRPDDAVVSLLLRKPDWEADEAYAEYVRFYATILPHRERFVVASFEQVVADFAPVVRRLNRRFGTAFVKFQHTPENVQRCFEHLERISLANGHGGAEFEMAVARPSPEREGRKRIVRARILESSLERLRQEAARLHAAYASEAERP